MKTGEVERILDSIEMGFSPEYPYCCLDTYLIPGDVLELVGFRGMRMRCAGEPGLWIRTEGGSSVYLFWNGLVACPASQSEEDGVEAVRTVVNRLQEEGLYEDAEVEILVYEARSQRHRSLPDEGF